MAWTTTTLNAANAYWAANKQAIRNKVGNQSLTWIDHPYGIYWLEQPYGVKLNGTERSDINFNGTQVWKAQSPHATEPTQWHHWYHELEFVGETWAVDRATRDYPNSWYAKNMGFYGARYGAGTGIGMMERYETPSTASREGAIGWERQTRNAYISNPGWHQVFIVGSEYYKLSSDHWNTSAQGISFQMYRDNPSGYWESNTANNGMGYIKCDNNGNPTGLIGRNGSAITEIESAVSEKWLVQLKLHWDNVNKGFRLYSKGSYGGGYTTASTAASNTLKVVKGGVRRTRGVRNYWQNPTYPYVMHINYIVAHNALP